MTSGERTGSEYLLEVMGSFMKKLLLTAGMILSLLLSGCSTSLSVDGVLAPPKLSNQQNQIYSALEAQVGKNITLKYPKSGDYRSAFVLADIDSDNEDEALVFYEPNIVTPNSTNLRVNVLDRNAEGEWFSTCDIAGEGGEVDKISFADLGYQGKRSIIIGYSSTGTSEKYMVIYVYDEEMLQKGFSQAYSIYETAKLTGSEYEDLVFVSANMQGEVAVPTAKLLQCIDSQFMVVEEVAMNRNVTEYVNVKQGLLFSMKPALYFDGLEGGGIMCTEIVSFDGKSLYNSIYNDGRNLVKETRRRAGIYCRDIDGDGEIEIPTQELMPGYVDGRSENIMYVTQWKSYTSGGEFEVKKKTFMNSNEGYVFELPEHWIGTVSAKKTTESDDVKFFVYQGSLEEDGQEILRMKTVRRTELDQTLERGGYFEIASVGQLSYVAKISASAPEEYRISEEDLIGRFSSIVS